MEREIAKFSLFDQVDTSEDDRQSNRSFRNRDGVMPDVLQVYFQRFCSYSRCFHHVNYEIAYIDKYFIPKYEYFFRKYLFIVSFQCVWHFTSYCSVLLRAITNLAVSLTNLLHRKLHRLSVSTLVIRALDT